MIHQISLGLFLIFTSLFYTVIQLPTKSRCTYMLPVYLSSTVCLILMTSIIRWSLPRLVLLFILVYSYNLSRGSPGTIEQSCKPHLLSNMEMGLQHIYPACIMELSLLWSSLSPLVTTHFKAHSLLGWPFLCMLSSSFALSFIFYFKKTRDSQPSVCLKFCFLEEPELKGGCYCV